MTPATDVQQRTSTRWVGTGGSSSRDAFEAGREAATRALAGRDGPPGLLVVFCSDEYDLNGLLAGIREQAPDTPLLGCSTAGEIADGGPSDHGVVVTAMGGAGFSFATASASAGTGDLREAGAAAAACINEVEARPHRALLLLTDGLAGDQREFVRGAYRVVGAEVPLVGGCAGDGLRMRRTFQLHDRDVLTNAVVAAAIASDAPIGIGIRHGWRRTGDAMLVSGSDANRVYTLNDEPALDVYLDRLDAPAEARRNHGAFIRFALTHPLGLSRRGGEDVRFVADADFDDRSLQCIAQVPQGALAWIMEGDDASVLAATDAACRDALTGLDGAAPVGVLAFDCIARRGVLGEEHINAEVARIAHHAGGAPVAGFYTYGEIARTHGTSGFHNQTLVVLALA